jgi:hypothetical protein
MRTCAVEVSIHAVSPELMVLAGGAAGAAAAAVAVAAVWAQAAVPAMAVPSAAASARIRGGRKRIELIKASE